MIYKDGNGGVLDIEIWDGCDMTEDVLGEPRSDADLGLLVETARNYAYGRGGFDLPEAAVRADWTLTSPDAGAECGQAWSSDLYDYCTGCGILLNEDCVSTDPYWCVWCAGEA